MSNRFWTGMFAENLGESIIEGVLVESFLWLWDMGDGTKVSQKLVRSPFRTISKSSAGEDSGLNLFLWRVIIREVVGGTLTGLGLARALISPIGEFLCLKSSTLFPPFTGFEFTLLCAP